MIGVSEKQKSVANFEFSRDCFVHLRCSFRTPKMRPRNDLSRPVLVGDLGNGYNGSEHGWMINGARMKISVSL